MRYSELQATPSYANVPAGAAIRVVLVRVSDGATVLVGSTTGLSWSDDFEQNPILEAGLEGIDEHATGAHTGAANASINFRPETNDLMPTRDSFLGEGEGVEYTIFQVKADRRVGPGIPISVCEGCKITRYATEQGARGILTAQLSFVYQRRYSGAEWATKTGDPDYATA